MSHNVSNVLVKNFHLLYKHQKMGEITYDDTHEADQLKKMYSIAQL